MVCMYNIANIQLCVRLQFLGAKKARLGCPFNVCDSPFCPSYSNNYYYFDALGGKIFSEGTCYSAIKYGQRVRLCFANAWMSCAKTIKNFTWLCIRMYIGMCFAVF